MRIVSFTLHTLKLAASTYIFVAVYSVNSYGWMAFFFSLVLAQQWFCSFFLASLTPSVQPDYTNMSDGWMDDNKEDKKTYSELEKRLSHKCEQCCGWCANNAKLSVGEWFAQRTNKRNMHAHSSARLSRVGAQRVSEQERDRTIMKNRKIIIGWFEFAFVCCIFLDHIHSFIIVLFIFFSFASFLCFDRSNKHRRAYHLNFSPIFFSHLLLYSFATDDDD